MTSALLARVLQQTSVEYLEAADLMSMEFLEAAGHGGWFPRSRPTSSGGHGQALRRVVAVGGGPLVHQQCCSMGAAYLRVPQEAEVERVPQEEVAAGRLVPAVSPCHRVAFPAAVEHQLVLERTSLYASVLHLLYLQLLVESCSDVNCQGVP